MKSPMIQHRDNRGMAIIGVIVALAMLVALTVALAVTVTSDTQLRGAFARTTIGFYAAESGLNRGLAEYRNIFLNYNVPTGSDFNQRSFALNNRTVTYQLSARPGNPQNVIIPSGELFAGLNAIQYRYTVNSEAAGVNNEVEAEVGAEFLVGYIPLFQFVAFYAGDLEILPGPPMNLNGRVHTNGNLYLGAGNTLAVADNPAQGILSSQVSAGRDIYRGRKDASICEGTVSVDMIQDVVAPFGDLDPRALPCSGAGTRLVPAAELAAWQGGMLSNVASVAVPQPDMVQRGSGSYWTNADLRIVLKLNQASALPGGPLLPHTIEVQDVNGNQDAALTAQLYAFMIDETWNRGLVGGRGPSLYPGTYPLFYTAIPLSGAGCGCSGGTPGCGSTNAACYNPTIPAGQPPNNARVFAANMQFDGDFRRGGYYNHREHKWMQLLNINVRDLLLWNQQNGNPFFAPNDSTHGGIVLFVSVEGPDSNGINNYGVRVFGSANLPIPGGIGASPDPTGLTVASDQALYVLGDYNRGTVYAGDLPRQPAAFIGDSINIMSNNYWNPACAGSFCRDGQSVLSLNDPSRAATNTWVNAAFLGGVDVTAVGNYNGGLENYPRFHEEWSGRTFTYRGSFVSLGQPLHANGAWCGTGTACKIYNPPDRNWNYDPAFNDAANLPPMTPRSVYLQQTLFTQDFR